MNNDYTKQSATELRALFVDITDTINAQKQMLADIQAELLRRHGAALKARLEASGKTDGSASLELDGVKLTYKVGKEIDWDNDKLKTIAASMDWATASRVFDIKFKVPERVYNAIPDPALVARLNEARTVTYKEPVVVFAKE